MREAVLCIAGEGETGTEEQSGPWQSYSLAKATEVMRGEATLTLQALEPEALSCRCPDIMLAGRFFVNRARSG